MDQLRFSEAADLFADQRQQFLFQRVVELRTVHGRDEGIDALALDVMRIADHRRFSDGIVQHQGAFYFGSANAVAGDIDHVIYSAGNPVVTVFVAACTIAREVITGVGLEIGVDHALMVAIDAANLARPTLLDRQYATACAWYLIALLIKQHGLHAEERSGGRTGLEVGGTGQRGDENGPGFGLPPGVDDRAATLANHVEVPLPGFRVDRFAHRAEQAQAAARGGFDRVFALTHQGA